MDLHGRTAVVTGASSGIGEAVARRLAAEGACVALLARRKDRIEAVAAECGGLAVEVDVASHAAQVAAAELVRDRLGPVDLVVANAGFLQTDPVLDAEPDRAAELVTTNLTGAAWTARIFATDLRAAAASGGRADVVFVSSGGGMPIVALYGATKAAVAHLARAMRVELAPAGVRVHDVEPAWTTTPLADDYAATLGIPLPDPAAPQPLTPDDVAAAVAYCVAAPPNVNVSHLALTPTWLV
jgi:NADP-dependent 3-hydroxy acid dehydrogenase YdfG